jgi:hypothetical protein
VLEEPVETAPAIDDDVDMDGPMWPEPTARTVQRAAPQPVAEPAPAVEPEPVTDDLYTEDPDEQKALKQAYIFRHEAAEAQRVSALKQDGIDSGMIIDEDPVVPGEVVTYPGDEEKGERAPLTEGFASVTIEAIPGDDEAEGHLPMQAERDLPPEPEPYDKFDIAYEVERLLKNRNWGGRDGPFSGFKSPPGRF